MPLNQDNRAKKHLRLRRAKAALGHARKVYVKTREQAKRAADTTAESTEEYAVEQTRQLLEDALRDSAEAVGGGTRAALRRGRQLYGKRKAVEEQASPEVPQSQGEPPYEYAPTRSRDVLARDGGEGGNQPSTPTGRRTGGTRMANAQPITSQKPNTIPPKESANVPKAAQTARRKAAYTAGRKAHRAKAVRDKAAAVVRTTKNVLVSSVKAALDGAKALVAAVMAGGWVAILVVVVICVIGMMVGSAYGIFFSGEDTGSGETMQTVVREINEEYTARLDEIRASCNYDALIMAKENCVMIDSMFEKLICPEVMMEAVRAELKKCDPDYASEAAAFEAAVRLLKEAAGEGLSASVDIALSGEEQTMGERLIFLFWLGVQHNLACFRDPKEKRFLELDYEDIHHEAEVNKYIPSEPRGFTLAFIASLPLQAEEPLNQIIGYYSYMETVAYKLVHYKGFCFGDRFLKMVALGYCQNYLLTNMYTNKLEIDCSWLACL